MWLLRPVYSSRVSEISNLSFDSEVFCTSTYCMVRSLICAVDYNCTVTLSKQ